MSYNGSKNYMYGCKSKRIELDERMLRIIYALVKGPQNFSQLKRTTRLHQEILSRKIRILKRYCIVAYSGGYYYLCGDSLRWIKRMY